jgi:hypothetical protein
MPSIHIDLTSHTSHFHISSILGCQLQSNRRRRRLSSPPSERVGDFVTLAWDMPESDLDYVRTF